MQTGEYTPTLLHQLLVWASINVDGADAESAEFAATLYELVINVAAWDVATTPPVRPIRPIRPSRPPLLSNHGTSPLGNQGPIAATMETTFVQEGGLFYASSGLPLDGEYKVIVNQNGGIQYIPSWAGTHAELAGGAQVQSAGTMVFSEGRPISVNIHSGHYQPPVGHGYNTVLQEAIQQHGYHGPPVADAHN
jgi:hypothetical protein